MTGGKAIIFCAPSGSGKTTIVKHLVDKISVLCFSISATTRQPRNNERHGVDYYFLTNEDFKERLSNNSFYEWQEVYADTFYGTLRSEVERLWDEGFHVIFDLDVVGAYNLKKILGDQALSIFVKVKDLSVLRQRLLSRKSESEESLNTRVAKAAEEMEMADKFDYVLVNDVLNETFIEAEHVVDKFLNQK